MVQIIVDNFNNFDFNRKSDKSYNKATVLLSTFTRTWRLDLKILIYIYLTRSYFREEIAAIAPVPPAK